MELKTSVGKINVLTGNLRSALKNSNTRLTSEELNRIDIYYKNKDEEMNRLVNEDEFVGHYYSNKALVKNMIKQVNSI